jgi:hypothetical protein
MRFRMFFQLLELGLQLGDGFLEVQMVFHLGRTLRFSAWTGNEERQCFSSISGTKIKETDLHPALSGDEVYTPSPRRSEW